VDLSQARHAFITGGASGIGLAIAEALAARGVPVTVADVNEASLAAATTDGRLRGQRLDVRDRAAWARAKAEAEAALGPVDLLVLNAGIAPDGTHLADMDPESFDRVIAINLGGVFNGISAFAADMRARGRGHIVTTSSMSGMAADWPGLGSYSTSKFAVVAMTEVLRMEMEPHGVGVSSFCPGTTATNLMANSRALGSNTQGGADASLLGMPVQPAEVAAKVLRGIEENRAYILTHPERRPSVERRFAGIMAGFDAG
jgi:NAD(P)-dependent dehydrogenase (short-subunit alcohol dehydrogenase family)